MSLSHLKFTEEHEWVRKDGDVAVIGISTYAADELGEIVYVDLPSKLAQFEQMQEFGTIESVKTLSSLYMPVTGEVCDVNNAVVKNPGLINESPYEEGWLVKVKLSDEKELDDLMTHAEYQNYLESL